MSFELSPNTREIRMVLLPEEAQEMHEWFYHHVNLEGDSIPQGVQQIFNGLKAIARNKPFGGPL